MVFTEFTKHLIVLCFCLPQLTPIDWHSRNLVGIEPTLRNSAKKEFSVRHSMHSPKQFNSGINIDLIIYHLEFSYYNLLSAVSVLSANALPEGDSG
ncbi:hypothetical protein [Bacteroides sp. AN502(2024)]|uniref:hypothetical protein n=1 Tax=Bacteroides sp. AN502(2024) TaxID=3160599 RepID=UPI0035167111